MIGTTTDDKFFDKLSQPIVTGFYWVYRHVSFIQRIKRVSTFELDTFLWRKRTQEEISFSTRVFLPQTRIVNGTVHSWFSHDKHGNTEYLVEHFQKRNRKSRKEVSGILSDSVVVRKSGSGIQSKRRFLFLFFYLKIRFLLRKSRIGSHIVYIFGFINHSYKVKHIEKSEPMTLWRTIDKSLNRNPLGWKTSDSIPYTFTRIFSL